MKYRIAKKKLKKDALLNLWIKSDLEWADAFMAAEKRGDETSMIVIADMSRYDWLKILDRGERLGFGYRTINKYFCECK